MTDNSRRTGAAIEAHYRFVVWLAAAIEKFPKSHKFTIGERIETTALDVLEALIEAIYTRERIQHLRSANLGIEKLRFLLRLAADLKLLDRRRCGACLGSLASDGRRRFAGAPVHLQEREEAAIADALASVVVFPCSRRRDAHARIDPNPPTHLFGGAHEYFVDRNQHFDHDQDHDGDFEPHAAFGIDDIREGTRRFIDHRELA